MKKEFLNQLIKEIKSRLTFNNQQKHQYHNGTISRTFKVVSSFMLTICLSIGVMTCDVGLQNSLNKFNDAYDNNNIVEIDGLIKASTALQTNNDIYYHNLSFFIDLEEKFYKTIVKDFDELWSIGIYVNESLYQLLLKICRDEDNIYEAFSEYLYYIKSLNIYNEKKYDYRYIKLDYGMKIAGEIDGYHFVKAFDLYKLGILDESNREKRVINLFDVNDTKKGECLVQNENVHLNKKYYVASSALNVSSNNYLDIRLLELGLIFGGVYESVDMCNKTCIKVSYGSLDMLKKDEKLESDCLILKYDEAINGYYDVAVLNTIKE